MDVRPLNVGSRCALAAWLLDPDIDAQERVGRTLALRYEGMEQQLKFGKAADRPQTELTAAKKQMGIIEQDALKVGIPSFAK